MNRDNRLLHRITAVLLQYPDQSMLANLDHTAAALPALRRRDSREQLGLLIGWLRTLDVEAAQHYVATFDHTPLRTLHLTYYQHGDTRARGMALLALKHTYRQAGYHPVETELPDFLPLILEFAALAPRPGTRILRQYRAGLGLLRQALREADSPYAAALDAVCAGLPGPMPGRLDLVHPPTETVGLEPFAPPQFLTGGHQ